MEKELVKFIRENKLSPFNKYKTSLNKSGISIFKTKDAKLVHQRVLSQISSNFVFADTSNLLNFFAFTSSHEEIKRRQEFFGFISKKDKFENNFLNQIKNPRPKWKPSYDIVVVTENTETFQKLKEMGCPAQLIISETDVALLEDRDLVQIVDSGDYSIALESLPQSVFIKSLDGVYLERHLEALSGWEDNLNLLKGELRDNYLDLLELLNLTNDEKQILSREDIEDKIDKVNEEISEKIKDLTVSGSSLVMMLSKGALPDEIKKIVNETLDNYNIPRSVINPGIPVSIDEEELENQIRRQSLNKFSSHAEKIKSNSESLKEIPERLKELSDYLIYYDFISGISQFINQEMFFPASSEEFFIKNSKNIFLPIETVQGINFHLDLNSRCSILTGANSGGKTTLIEHIIQLISLYQLGLPVYGEVKMPVFQEIYYFAKNKGSMSKGAFETLLTQMSQISPGEKTLILADEIEAVTEPGVAGNIISATADYFLKKGCFLVIATHLGYEIQKSLPQFSRIDGIEAKGLDENFELIVDHNPVLGRLAHSTPELIVEKMANSPKTANDYFKFLNDFLKNKN